VPGFPSYLVGTRRLHEAFCLCDIFGRSSAIEPLSPQCRH